jgi:hypothetical protein
MIRVVFSQPRARRWSEWKRRCRDYIRPHLAPPHRPPEKVDADLYKECKDLIFKGYANKCAYCEGKIEAQSPGDVEHFRPKNAVRDIDNKIVYEAGRKPHRGYWWLAYDATNLLPSCIMCNRFTRKAGGKGERFPVSGFRATRPGEERREKPLLIHPGRSDPKRHFELDMDTGALKGRTEQGRACIEVFGLNRDGLLEARFNAILEATVFLTHRSAANRKAVRQRVKQQLEGLLAYTFIWRTVKASTGRARKPARRRR